MRRRAPVRIVATTVPRRPVVSLVGRAIDVVGLIGIILVGIGITRELPDQGVTISMIGALMIGAWVVLIYVRWWILKARSWF